MKQKKAFKPRTGIRFDRSHVQGPDGAFLGDEVVVTVLTGSVCASVQEPADGPDTVDDSIGPFGTYYETRFLNNKLLGLGTASLGRGAGTVTVTTGSIPSWANSHIRNSAFVVQALSASDHEVQSLGLWRSGSEPLEGSPVPASASMYYSKHGRYTKVTVKKTASVQDLSRLPTTIDGGTPILYIPGKGTDITRVTGNLEYLPNVGFFQQYSTVLFPAMIPIEVPHKGKIVDIKVWVELAQVSGSGAEDGLGGYPLGNLTISLRSPNLRGFHAHPIRNDQVLKRVFTSDLSEFSAFSIFGQLGKSFFGPSYIAPSYRDAFILWEGPGFIGEGTTGPWDVDDESNGGEHFATRRYPAWQRDRSIRTVFSDGAPVPNPRHHVGASPSASYNGSPNSAFGLNSAYGFDVPWTSETEISGANTYASAGSPPRGWLSGPGGSNLADEWPTTGVNYGAEFIRPVYPMLDPLYQRKRFGDIPRRPNTGSAIFDPGKWTGYRPGLRGTEASGTWYLMVADSRPAFASGLADDYTPTYFRQVRLELTLESGSYTDPRIRASSRLAPRRASSELLVVSISGSDSLIDATGSWDAHVSDTYLASDDPLSEVGRTIGVGFLTGSAEADGQYALLYRLTGALADLSGSTPAWLLNNPFGMPSIPVSSASFVPCEVVPVQGAHPQSLVDTRPLLDGARRLPEAARDAGRPLTAVQKFARSLSGSAT